MKRTASYLRAQNFAVPSVNVAQGKYNDCFEGRIQESLVACTTNNIMFNNRVCRGNTYACPVITEDQRRNQEVYERNQLARRRRKEELRKQMLPRPGTPPPVAGRVHVEIQTDPFLDECFNNSNQNQEEMSTNCHDQGQSTDNRLEIPPLEKSGVEQEEGHSDKHEEGINGQKEKGETTLNKIAPHNDEGRIDISASKEDTSNKQIDQWEESLTGNLAKVILCEAKSKALENLGQTGYNSDPER